MKFSDAGTPSPDSWTVLSLSEKNQSQKCLNKNSLGNF